jgi:hypothetical protein
MRTPFAESSFISEGRVIVVLPPVRPNCDSVATTPPVDICSRVIFEFPGNSVATESQQASQKRACWNDKLDWNSFLFACQETGVNFYKTRSEIALNSMDGARFFPR